MTGPERYRVDVSSDVIDDLRARLARPRLPDEPPRPGWQDSTDHRTLNRLLRRWRHQYDWAAHQDDLRRIAVRRDLRRQPAAPGADPNV